MRKSVLPDFEKDFDCKVDAQQGSTLGQIALLRASKDAGKFTVMFVDDLGVEIAGEREGVSDTLRRTRCANLDEVYSRLRLPGWLWRWLGNLVRWSLLK